jgi:uncharacterized spore protein YtfJ
MDVRELMEQARDVLTVKRVYGEPVETGGVTVIPAARVRGGGGGGEGHAGNGHRGDGEDGGSGGGFGLEARPVGAYVIRDGKVSWQPAVDVNRVVLGGQITAIVGIMALRRLLGARTGRAHHRR